MFSTAKKSLPIRALRLAKVACGCYKSVAERLGVGRSARAFH